MTDHHPIFDPPPPAGELKPLLIEEWLPVPQLGIESVRESAPIPGQFPKIKSLHVWWARRPLAAAQGVQLAALLPGWSPLLTADVPSLKPAIAEALAARRDISSSVLAAMSDEERYRTWVLWLTGVWGDPVARRRELDEAKITGRNLGANPYGYAQAFKNVPSSTQLAALADLLRAEWGRLPIVLDPTAGGGSIPYTAARFGLPTVANDLNPVAVSLLELGVQLPASRGTRIVEPLRRWGEVLVERCTTQLADFYELEDPDEHVTAYLWVNTVTCPRTGGVVPLAPNWWLDSKGKKSKTSSRPKVAVRPVGVRVDGSPSHIRFEIVEDPEGNGYDPSVGTVSRGDAVSPWDDGVIDGAWIKAEAQAGRMEPILYAVACWKSAGGRRKKRYFRAPDETDLRSVEAAGRAVAERMPIWEANGVIPTEAVPVGNKTDEPRRYGMLRWTDMFAPRQLLAHGVFNEEWQRLRGELLQDEEFPKVEADAVMGILALMSGKALNYNARMVNWHPSRATLANVFDRHDFGFSWTFGEFDGARALWPWCLDQIVDAYEGLARLIVPHERNDARLIDESEPTPGPVEVLSGSATELNGLKDGSVECVNIDPPYYDNVMYAELADFFYVWEKRTLGLLHPERFSDELTNKDAEAVANSARFDHLRGKAKKQTANLDYQNKMRDIFAEARRVLRDDGVMVVWFTHKAADAWDTLGAAIMDAGFTVEASWPVNTESATSLHQAKKNAAKSTIVLVCRKRPESSNKRVVFFEDIVADVRAAARAAATEFETVVGHGGVDLMLSTYGPALGVLSSQWPVMSSEADAAGNAIPLKPEEALAVARTEVARLRMARLVGEERQFDPATDFAVIAWDTYRAKKFPYDEARKLALGVGSDVDDLVADKVLSKSGGNVEFVDPTARVARRIDSDGPFGSLYDAISVMLRMYDLDGAAAVRAWLVERGFDTPGPFRQALAAYGLAVPRVRGKKGWMLDEARLLEEVASNVPALELHLADADEELIAPEQQSMDV